MRMPDELIKEYITNGGKLFIISQIDSIRDGGTVSIKCNNREEFFIDKYTNNFHSGYPTNNDNLITDNLLKQYLIDRFEANLHRNEDHVRWLKFVLDKINL